jgi:hypothetical protein
MYTESLAMTETCAESSAGVWMEVEVENPTQILAQALAKVGKMFQNLETRFSVDAADMYCFIRQREIKLYDAIVAEWDSLDNDIYSRYLKNEASRREIEQWRCRLQNWKRLLSAAVQLYRVHLHCPEQANIAYEL